MSLTNWLIAMGICIFMIIMGLVGRELARIAEALEERNKQTFKDQ